jgi:hypothetical protein
VRVLLEVGHHLGHRGVAVQVAFESKGLKPVFHLIGSRVETRCYQAMGQFNWIQLVQLHLGVPGDVAQGHGAEVVALGDDALDGAGLGRRAQLLLADDVVAVDVQADAVHDQQRTHVRLRHLPDGLGDGVVGVAEVRGAPERELAVLGVEDVAHHRLVVVQVEFETGFSLDRFNG